MGVVEAIILGVVQGVTEFLPVSSSGHLILVRELFGFDATKGLAFDAILHFATALAVVVYFWRDVLALLGTARSLMSEWGVAFFRGQSRPSPSEKPTPHSPDSRRLLLALVVATIPAVILGLLLEDAMETTFRSALLVAGTLVAGSVVMLAAEWHARRIEKREVPDVSRAFSIGLFQSLALVPGMSRAGMAISGGMLLGLSREKAARFAFLLAIPLLLGAGGKKLLELSHSGALSADLLPIVLGASVAFIVGIGAIHFLITLLRTYSLMPFIIYRVVLAVVVLLVFV